MLTPIRTHKIFAHTCFARSFIASNAIKAIAASVLLLGSSFARAEFLTGPVAAAMGGAGRAAADPGESVLLNPASLPHLQFYTVASHFLAGWHSRAGNERGFALLISDGTPDTLFPGALSFSRRWTDFAQGAGSVMEQDLQLTVGGMIGRKVALGVSGRRRNWVPVEGLSGVYGQEYAQNNADIGLLATPVKWLGIGLVASDILNTDENIPRGVRLVPTYGVGAHILMYENFRLRLDLVRPDVDNPDRRTNVMVGLESHFAEEGAFRLGAQWRETADQMWLSAGFGFLGPRLRVDYTFQKDVRVADGTRHLFDLWLPL
jgi:hypothetical protein